MKTLLVNPYLTVREDDPAQPNPMLGLGYLAAYLEREGLEVDILDAMALGEDEVRPVGSRFRYGLEEAQIKERIKSYGPDVVGITACSTLHASDVHDTARMVKEISPEILVVTGGAHASASYDSVLEDPNVDMVIRGEGEDTLLDLVRAVQARRSLKEIPGTAVKDNGQIKLNQPRPVIQDLDTIPFPARHLLPMDVYFYRHKKGPGHEYAMREKAVTMVTSRGCPGDCIYCSVKTVWGRRWRGRSPKNVVDEIEQIVRDYDAREIAFLDDSMSVQRKRLMGICDEIIDRRLDIRWTTPNGIAIWLLNEELITKMKRAGCYRITFGLESGNRETLRYLGKKYDYDYAKRMIKFAHKTGLWTIGTFIIGFPYEQMDSINDTINFALDSYLDFAVFYIANPLPGTEMHHIFQQEGLLPDSPEEIVRGCGTKYFTAEELYAIQGDAFARFMSSRLRRPWQALTKIDSVESLRYALRLARNISRGMISRERIKEKGIAALWKK